MRWRELKNPYTGRLAELERMSPRELLGVAGDATREEVRQAYLTKIRVHHPDKNDEFMKEFAKHYSQLINLAYDKIMEEFS